MDRQAVTDGQTMFKFWQFLFGFNLASFICNAFILVFIHYNYNLLCAVALSGFAVICCLINIKKLNKPVGGVSISLDEEINPPEKINSDGGFIPKSRINDKFSVN